MGATGPSPAAGGDTERWVVRHRETKRDHVGLAQPLPWGQSPATTAAPAARRDPPGAGKHPQRAGEAGCDPEVAASFLHPAELLGQEPIPRKHRSHPCRQRRAEAGGRGTGGAGGGGRGLGALLRWWQGDHRSPWRWCGGSAKPEFPSEVPGMLLEPSQSPRGRDGAGSSGKREGGDEGMRMREGGGPGELIQHHGTAPSVSPQPWQPPAAAPSPSPRGVWPPRAVPALPGVTASSHRPRARVP